MLAGVIGGGSMGQVQAGAKDRLLQVGVGRAQPRAERQGAAMGQREGADCTCTTEVSCAT